MVTLRIEGIDPKGWAYSFYKNKKIFVRYGVPGDVVKARLGRKWANIVEIIEPSNYRVKLVCKHFGLCGGCRFQNIDYKAQLDYKKNLILNYFRKNELSAEVKETVPSPKIYFYRNRMDYPCGLVNNRVAIGLRKAGRWDVLVPLSECYLMSKESVEIIKIIKEFMIEKGIDPYDIFRQEGFVRYVVIREGKFTGDRLINIVTSRGSLLYTDELIQRLKKWATGIIWSINPSLADVSIGGEINLLYGKDYLEEEINGIKYYVHPNAFFQTNSYQAVNMVKIVKDLVSGGEILLDLYCGVGLFSLQLRELYKKVLGVEVDKNATFSAEINIKNFGENIELFKGEAEDILSKYKGAKPTSIIVDPPRAGLSEIVIKNILRLKPKEIIYVSCNPESMARDIKSLIKSYRLEGEVMPIDMFPQTPHVEAIAKLVSK